MRILLAYQNTRTNKEDIALTPYLFGVLHKGDIKIYGIGICWFYQSLALMIGFNVPKTFLTFRNFSTNSK